MARKQDKQNKNDQDVIAIRLKEFNLFCTPLTQRLFAIAKWGLLIMTIGAIIVSGRLYSKQLEYFFEDYYLEELGDFIYSTNLCDVLMEDSEILECFLSKSKSIIDKGSIKESNKHKLKIVIDSLEELQEYSLIFSISEMSNYYLVYQNVYFLLPSDLRGEYPRGEIFIFFRDFLPSIFVFYVTGYLVVTVLIFTFSRFANKVPETLLRLWNRDIIRLKTSGTSENTDSDIRLEFINFVDAYQKRMEHPVQLILCGAFAAIMIWRVFATQAIFPEGVLSAPTEFLVLELVSQPLIGFIVGALFWRLVITSIFFLQLGMLYELTPQLEHPDKVGGMAVLGNLFLWNALTFVWPAIFFSVWYVLIRNFDIKPLEILGGSLVHLNQIRSAVFTFFLIGGILLVITSFVSFFLPLYGVHREMLRFRRSLNERLDEFSVRIDDLKHELFGSAGVIPSDEGTEKYKQIELMQKIHFQYQKIPTWPYDTQTIIKLIGAQMGPILALIGVGESVIELIKPAIESLAK